LPRGSDGTNDCEHSANNFQPLSSFKFGITPPKAASMLSGCPWPQPSVDVFTADERLVLRGWFRNSTDPFIERILAGWKLAAPPPLCSALDVAVAAILLERVQLRHPRLGATVVPTPDPAAGTIFTVDPVRSAPTTSIVPLSRHLFTLRWRDQRQRGVFWPSTYTATPLPGTDKIVLAASDDSGNSFPFAPDTAIGWVAAMADYPEAIGTVVRREWSRLRDHSGEGRWSAVSRTGLLDEAILTTWADAVWS
jgi:hypothetical protein